MTWDIPCSGLWAGLSVIGAVMLIPFALRYSVRGIATPKLLCSSRVASSLMSRVESRDYFDACAFFPKGHHFDIQPEADDARAPRSKSTSRDYETSYFSRLSPEWWSTTGEFALLHRMNPTRVEDIPQKLLHSSEPEWTLSLIGHITRRTTRHQLPFNNHSDQSHDLPPVSKERKRKVEPKISEYEAELKAIILETRI
jgi:hypothetical protein